MLFYKLVYPFLKHYTTTNIGLTKIQILCFNDDYDYGFNYNHAPILPLASHYTNVNYISIGSICKSVAPVFRIGYLIASKEFVDEASKLRGFLFSQNCMVLKYSIKEGLQTTRWRSFLLKSTSIVNTTIRN